MGGRQCHTKASASHCQNSAGSISHGWLPWLFCRAHPPLSVGIAAWATLLTQSCAQTQPGGGHKEALLPLDRTYKLPGNNQRLVPWTNPVCEEKQQEAKSRSHQGVLRSLSLPCWVMGTPVTSDIEAGAHSLLSPSAIATVLSQSSTLLLLFSYHCHRSCLSHCSLAGKKHNG